MGKHYEIEKSRPGHAGFALWILFPLGWQTVVVVVPLGWQTVVFRAIVVAALMPMVTRGHDEAVTVWPLAADLLPPASAAPRAPPCPLPHNTLTSVNFKR